MMNWSTMSQREQRLLQGLGGVLVLLVLYVLIYSPWMHAIEAKQQRLEEKKATYLWMKTQHQQHPGVRKLVNESQLLSLIAHDLDTSAFKSFPYHLQQTGEHRILLTYETVPYVAFMAWLWDLSTHVQVSLEQWTADRTAVPGLVKLRVIFLLPYARP